MNAYIRKAMSLLIVTAFIATQAMPAWALRPDVVEGKGSAIGNVAKALGEAKGIITIEQQAQIGKILASIEALSKPTPTGLFNLASAVIDVKKVFGNFTKERPEASIADGYIGDVSLLRKRLFGLKSNVIRVRDYIFMGDNPKNGIEAYNTIISDLTNIIMQLPVPATAAPAAGAKSPAEVLTAAMAAYSGKEDYVGIIGVIRTTILEGKLGKSGLGELRGLVSAGPLESSPLAQFVARAIDGIVATINKNAADRKAFIGIKDAQVANEVKAALINTGFKDKNITVKKELTAEDREQADKEGALVVTEGNAGSYIISAPELEQVEPAANIDELKNQVEAWLSV